MPPKQWMLNAATHWIGSLSAESRKIPELARIISNHAPGVYGTWECDCGAINGDQLAFCGACHSAYHSASSRQDTYVCAACGKHHLLQYVHISDTYPMRIPELQVTSFYNGSSRGDFVTLDGEQVFFTKNPYERDMFIAELKARIAVLKGKST